MRVAELRHAQDPISEKIPAVRGSLSHAHNLPPMPIARPW
jgi:hypothetical protein